MKYSRQHTNWKLVCQKEVDAGDLRDNDVSGVLSILAQTDVQTMSEETGIPTVLIGNSVSAPNARYSSVAVDEHAVGVLAAQYFAQLGLKHFAYIGHGEWPFVISRLEGFSSEVAKRGFGRVHQHLGILHDQRRRKRMEKDIAALLRSLPRPCGLLTANDLLGVLVVSTCQSLNIRVPDDIAVLGVDDDELECELSDVPLSSIAQPLVAIGYEAARLLHVKMQHPATEPAQLSLPPLKVMERASSDLIALQDKDVVAAVKLINDHASEAINVEWIVSQLPVGRRSLERRFKSVIGRTVLEQIHHVRLQKAKELLSDSDLPFNVVAERSGMANARWMADQFRRQLGITPSRFRRHSRTVS